MVNFIEWLFVSFSDLIASMSGNTVLFVQNTMNSNAEYDVYLGEIDIKLTLFSDTPILSTNVFDLLLLVFSVFYTVVFVVIIYKIIKKVLVTITRWNKW